MKYEDYLKRIKKMLNDNDASIKKRRYLHIYRHISNPNKPRLSFSDDVSAFTGGDSRSTAITAATQKHSRIRPRAFVI